MTPTLSVEAVQASVIDVAVNALRVSAVGALGAVASGQAAVAAAKLGLVERLLAASNASTARVYVVPQARPVKVYEVAVVLPALVVPL